MNRRDFLIASTAATAVGLGATGSARADTLSTARERGRLIVGMEAAFVPFEFVEDGKIVGFDVDLANAFTESLGIKAEFIDTALAGVIPALYAGKFDCIISGMTITAERAEKVIFSVPYADASSAVLIRKGDDRIKSAADLSGKILGVQLGGATVGILETFDARLKEAGGEGLAEIKQYDHNPEAYEDLVNGRVDAVANSLVSLMIVMRDMPDRFEIVEGISDIPAYFGMAFRQEDTALRDAANDHLRAMKADGSLADLQLKWFGRTMTVPDDVPVILP